MKKFRVAHVITRLCKGGAQKNTFHTVRLANRERFDVDLISGPTKGREGSIEPAVRDAGIEIVRVPYLVRRVAPLHDYLAMRQLTALFVRNRYDIVHTHTSKAGFLGRLAAVHAKTPIIVHTPHGNIFHGYFPKYVTRAFVWMERHAARRTDRIIELTPGGIEEHLAEWIGRREQYVTIFSGIDLSPYDAAIARRNETRRALGVADNQLLVGGVGRLEPVKGFRYLVSAARLVLESVPNARFIVAGTGALAKVLRAEAADLDDRFRFLGLRDDVPDLMAAMDVFVLPSLNEGMGRVLLEAGAAATPAVATSVGGVPDIIRAGETGILVPPREPEALANAVCILARDPGARQAMGQAARGAVAPAYGLDHMVARIEALYEALIEEKSLDA
ncbi:MAG: glycosyltransferase [Nitrospiraceae bacterium]|nr:glycosyltransferase [Nitrospiraceae bacterium]